MNALLPVPYKTAFDAVKSLWLRSITDREQVSVALSDLNAIMVRDGNDSITGREARSLIDELEPIFDVFTAAEADAERALLDQAAEGLADVHIKLGAITTREMVGSVDIPTTAWVMLRADLDRLVFKPDGIAS